MPSYVFPLLVAAGGALGALSRYGATLLLTKLAGPFFPYGTLAVNSAGSFLIGLLGVLLARVYPIPGAAAFLITGYLGGLTTFSSFMNETMQFFLGGNPMEGFCYLFLQLAGGLLFVSLGYFLADRLFL